MSLTLSNSDVTAKTASTSLIAKQNSALSNRATTMSTSYQIKRLVAAPAISAKLKPHSPMALPYLKLNVQRAHRH